MSPARQSFVFFDGTCNLCNRFVRFLIRRDKNRIFKLAPLQSEKSALLLADFGIIANRQNSVILLEDAEVSYRSTAVLRICKRLGGGWRLLYVFILIPPFIRNLMYDIIAGSRYRLFGKRSSCMVPDAAVRDRFLE